MNGGKKLNTTQKGMKEWTGRDKNGKIRKYGDNMSNRKSRTKEWIDLGNSASLKWRCRKHPARIHVPVVCLRQQSCTWNWLDAAAPHHFQSYSSKAMLPQAQELPCWKKPQCPWLWLFAMATALHIFLLKPLCILIPSHPSHLPLASLAPDPLLGLTRIILLSLVAPCALLLCLQRSQVADAAVEIVTQTLPAL